MEKRNLRIILCLAAVLSAAQAEANILPLAPESAGAVIRPRRDVEVSLDREAVDIMTGMGMGNRVVARFWLRSHAGMPIVEHVAFPLLPEGRRAEAFAESFMVLVDGEAVDAERRPGEAAASPDWIVWTMSWNPGQTRLVTCIYDSLMSERVLGLAGGLRFRYIVSTGRHWRGSIGEAVIRFRGSRVPAAGWDRRMAPSHDNHVIERTDRAVTWRFTDWIPGDEDLTLDLLTWQGMTPGGFRLPHPYRGADIPYDEAWLDALVEKELVAMRPVFPEKVAVLDRREVRAWIAEHLLMEIRARNGDSFAVGKVSGLRKIRRLWRLGLYPKPPPGGVIQGDVMYSMWRRYFENYGRLEGHHYRPGESITAVSARDLSGLERDNLEFLQRILNRTR